MKEQLKSLDVIRTLACCMVLTIHCCECYYVYNYYANGFENLNVAQWQDEAFWAGIIGTICRTCVPLFVMISGFLLLPVKQGLDMLGFYKRRVSRILIPLALWTVVYAFYTAIHFEVPFDGAGDFLAYIAKESGFFFVNFPPQIGHLWYVYMVLGLYLMIPVISPWIERASRKEMRVFLGIWLFTMLTPYLKLVWPEILGECYWNPNSTIYYFSGFIGYLVAGAYARKFLFADGKNYVGLGIALCLLGYVTALYGFLHQLYNLVPTADNYDSFMSQFEFTWYFDNITIGLETLGMFLLLFKLKIKKLPFVVSDFSRLSYGVYLCHIMFLTFYYDYIFSTCSWPTPCKILLMALMTIVTSYGVIKALSFVPKVKNWIG